MFLKQKKGFTLLEVLIATFILIVGVLGSVDLILSVFANVSVNEDKLTASYLAAEGIEIVRNLRDNGIALESGTYKVDWLTNNLINDDGEPLLDSLNYGFNYAEGAEKSKFRRTITINKNNDNKISVISKVDWQTRGRPFSIEVREYLYNWK